MRGHEDGSREAAAMGGCQRFARALRRADLDLTTRFTGARRAAVREPVVLRCAPRVAAADFPFVTARAFALAPDFPATDVVLARLRDAARLSLAALGAGFPAATPVLLRVLVVAGAGFAGREGADLRGPSWAPALRARRFAPSEIAPGDLVAGAAAVSTPRS